MTLLRDILGELRSMFIADARMTASVLCCVVLVALLHRLGLSGLVAAGILTAAVAIVLMVSVLTRRRK